MKKLIFAFSLILFFVSAAGVQAVRVGENTNFYIQPNYDLNQQEEISATLVKITSEFYFYIEDGYWYSLAYHQQKEIREALDDLNREFKEKIYPTLTSIFGSEWKPGIDNDSEITILIHLMPEKVGGYFNEGDEYSKIQVSNSNLREMIYLNARYLVSPQLKVFLAHEFMHLITFAQKVKQYNISEEVWLNEARAEYVSALLDYDSLEKGSYFQKKLESFVENPDDPLCEWQNKEADYGVINLFIRYLVDQYGIEILADSLHSDKTGIKSLNYALKKNGFKEDFSQVFSDWTIAVLINDCQLSPRYCYENKNLKNFRIAPSLNFLPFAEEGSLVLTNVTKNWSGNWFKFTGGKGDLKIRFIGSPENVYRVPYLSQDLSGNFKVDFLNLDSDQKEEISIPNFGANVISVTVIPTLQTKISDFSDQETSIPFFLEASIVQKPSVSILFEKSILEMSKQEILDKIAELEKVITQLKNQLKELTEAEEEIAPEEEISLEEAQISCQRFDQDLYHGLSKDDRVKCLQEFLKLQGPEIYPEGLVTSNFLDLTQKAVIRFQEKYAEDILSSWGLNKGTGFVGKTTRDKINAILSY